MQLNFQIPGKVVEELDKHVDGIRFRNRTQLITVILDDWLAIMSGYSTRKVAKRGENHEKNKPNKK